LAHNGRRTSAPTLIPAWIETAKEKRKAANRRSWLVEGKRLLRERRKSRVELVRALGGLCACCGSTRRLCFYRPLGGFACVQRLSVYARLKYYWTEFLAGNLELLCRRCLFASQRVD
jgi:hypothetical protein